jgi:hypothetical protein
VASGSICKPVCVGYRNQILANRARNLRRSFACKKLHLYLYGIPFTIITDHKPFEAILNNPRHQTSIRLQRILVRIMDYQFKVEYRPGKDNISDYTSRHPLPRDECSKQELSTSEEIKQYVNYMLPHNIPQAIGKEELKNPWKEIRHCKDSRSVLRKDEWGILQTSSRMGNFFQN